MNGGKQSKMWHRVHRMLTLFQRKKIVYFFLFFLN